MNPTPGAEVLRRDLPGRRSAQLDPALLMLEFAICPTAMSAAAPAGDEVNRRRPAQPAMD